jgi:hypothetical protein
MLQVPVRSTLASNMACSHHGKLRTREVGLTRSQRLHMLLDAQFYDSDGQLDYHKVGYCTQQHLRVFAVPVLHSDATTVKQLYSVLLQLRAALLAANVLLSSCCFARIYHCHHCAALTAAMSLVTVAQ